MMNLIHNIIADVVATSYDGRITKYLEKDIYFQKKDKNMIIWYLI